MRNVKIFSELHNYDALETEINQFLEESQETHELIDIKFATTTSKDNVIAFSALVITEGPDPEEK